MISESSLLGAAGEHYVMSQLLRRKFIAALAPVGVPNCDIVVTDDIGDRLCAIKVKARRNLGIDGGWHMQQKHENLRASRLFYYFVDFGISASDAPSTFVVPAKVVGETLELAHRLGYRSQERKGKLATTVPSVASFRTTSTWG